MGAAGENFGFFCEGEETEGGESFFFLVFFSSPPIRTYSSSAGRSGRKRSGRVL